MSARELPARISDWMRGHLAQLRALVRKRSVERELNEEMAWHIELETRKNEAAGMSRTEARRAALVEFGGVERYKEEVRESRWVRVVEELVSDLRYSMRMLGRQPALTLAVVATLALGIGGTAAVFKVVDALFFRPPAGVAEPGRVVRLFVVRDEGSIQTPRGGPGSFIDYEVFRARRTGFASIAAYLYPRQVSVGRGEDAGQAKGRAVTASFLPLLGVRPALGRFFLASEDSVEGRDPVVAISYGFWQRHFGGDSAVLGRELVVNGQSLTVVGVTAKEFTGIDAETIDLWVPAAIANAVGMMTFKDWRVAATTISTSYIGRLQPDAEVGNAASELGSALRISAEAHPGLDTSPSVIAASLIPARGPGRSKAADLSLWLALVAVMVLVVACANVANLLLARSVARRHELAVRLALGAGRVRLLRQHLTESLVLTLIGGAAGILVTLAGAGVVRHFSLPPSAGGVDARLLVFVFGLSLLIGFAFGIFIALHAASRPPVTGIREARTPSTLNRSLARRILVMLQVALSLMLLIGTALFVRSLRQVIHIDPGVDIDRLMVLSVDVSHSGYTTAERERLYNDALARVRHVPGVERAAMVHFAPLGGSAFGIAVDAPEHPERAAMQISEGPYLDLVGVGYFATVGTPLLRGRVFTDADAAGEPVGVVNEMMARYLAPGGNAIGNCYPLADQALEKKGCTRIIGVVGNQRHRFLSEPNVPMVFLPRERNPDLISWGTPSMMIRLQIGAKLPPERIRTAVQSLRADLPYVSVQPLRELVAHAVLPFQLGATLFSLFGCIAVILAAVGLYGVLVYFVTERTLEIGIRRSLGADARSVLSLVLRQAMVPVAIGLLAGLAASLGGTRFLASLLFGVTARDPISFVSASALLIVVATVAALIPARRAARVDPVIAMRAD